MENKTINKKDKAAINQHQEFLISQIVKIQKIMIELLSKKNII